MTKHTVLIISAALTFGACGDDPAETANSATATAAPAAFGVYSREVTDADFERTMGERNDAPGFKPSPPGRYQLTIAPGKGIDAVKVTDPTGVTVEMDAKVETDELRLVAYSAPEKGAFCDAAITAQAQYALTLRGDAVELAPTGEDCADRDSVLTGTWTKG